MSTDRCGYTHHAAQFPDRGACTCWRPTYEDADRCVWHADVQAKSPSALADARAQPGERLDGAIIRGTSLADSDRLAGTVLIGAEFENVDLEGASLRDADLRAASLTGVRAADADFGGANLEAATLQRTTLQDACFEDVLLDGVDLSACRIGRETTFDDVTPYERDLFETEDAAERERRFDAATWSYREVQTIARSNALLPTAEQYFRREKDLRRRYHWHERNYLRALRGEGARWVMGYGRSPWRILATSALVVIACAVLFPFVGALKDTAPPESVRYSLSVPPTGSPEQVIDALGTSLYFSVVTFGTLGYGDVEPIGQAARALAAIETLLGFALVALLISVLLQRGNWL